MWADHSIPNKQFYYHLNCRRTKKGSHKYDVSVLKKEHENKFTLYMPARTAGAPFLREYESLEKLNKFLKLLGLEILRSKP